MKQLVLFLAACTVFLQTTTGYRDGSNFGDPSINRFFAKIIREQQGQKTLSRQSRQNRFSSGGFNWDSSQNDFVFVDNDYDDDSFETSNIQNVPNTPPTTQRPQSSTVAVPGMATRRSICEDNCLATSQYDPVCGDNGVTYTNINWFKCAQKCGKNIKVKYMGACPRFR